MSTPVLTAPGLVARYTNQIDLQFRNDPDVLAYQVWGHRTVNGAYGDPTGSGVGGAGIIALFTVNRGQVFVSPTARRRGAGTHGESTRGTSRAIFDIDDFVVPANPLPILPQDDQWLFLRVQQHRVSTGALLVVPDGDDDAGDPILGPIYPVPPATFFGMAQPAFTMNGIAPSGTNCTLGNSPSFSQDGVDPGPLHIVFPRALAALRLQNTAVAGNLLFSHGSGQSMQTLAPGEETLVFKGNVKELLLAREADAGGVTFNLLGTMLLGQ